MSSVDWALLAVIATGGLLGMVRGAVRGALDLVALAIGIASVFFVTPSIADQLSRVGIEGRFVLIVAVLVMVGAVTMTMSFLLRIVAVPVGIVRAMPPFGWLDRFLGVVPGLIKGGVLTSLVILGVLMHAPRTGIAAQIRGSSIGEALALTGAKGFEEAAQQTGRDLSALTARDVEPGQSWVGAGLLPSEPVSVDPRAELEALDAINAVRGDAGLPALDPDAELTLIARQHARNAADAESVRPVPSMPDAADRLHAEGRTTLAVGAVMAVGPSIDEMVDALMASGAHRDIVLSTTYVTGGFGVVAGDNGDAILVGIFVL